jgi:hypothetical protein
MWTVQGLLAVLLVDDSPEELWRVSSPANNLLLPRKGQNTPKIGVDLANVYRAQKYVLFSFCCAFASLIKKNLRILHERFTF